MHGRRILAAKIRVDTETIAVRGPSSNARATPRPTIIVPDGARAYAMFLAPNDFQASNREYGIIRSAYNSMCSVLQNREAALWFSIDQFTNIVDRERSTYYARKVQNLDFSSAPFVVLTAQAPQKVKAGDTVVVVRLSGLSAQEVAQLLTFLEQQLSERPIDSRLQGKAFLRELALRVSEAWRNAGSQGGFKMLGSFSTPADFLFRLASS